jgi:hypothetical protein
MKYDRRAERTQDMKRGSLVSILFFSGLAFLPPLANPNIAQKPITPEPTSVSVVQLIATPERFYGKMVAVVGYLGLEMENNRLYLSEEDYRRNIAGNGVWIDVTKQVDIDREKLDMHYVQIAGVFKKRGPAGDGEISEVRVCQPWPEFTERRPRKPSER